MPIDINSKPERYRSGLLLFCVLIRSRQQPFDRLISAILM